MVRVLVTAATKDGATTEIAQAIAETLGEHGVRRPWLKPARELVERHAATLAGRPVWLFSSGPVGDPPKPEEDPVDVAELQDLTNAREHRVFAGKLVRRHLSFPERAIVSALRVPEGDFHDWTEIRQRAAKIADSMGSRIS